MTAHHNHAIVWHCANAASFILLGFSGVQLLRWGRGNGVWRCGFFDWKNSIWCCNSNIWKLVLGNLLGGIAEVAWPVHYTHWGIILWGVRGLTDFPRSLWELPSLGGEDDFGHCWQRVVGTCEGYQRSSEDAWRVVKGTYCGAIGWTATLGAYIMQRVLQTDWCEVNKWSFWSVLLWGLSLQKFVRQ